MNLPLAIQQNPPFNLKKMTDNNEIAAATEPYIFDDAALGAHHSPLLAAAPPPARRWLARALAWAFGFHHAEAAACALAAVDAAAPTPVPLAHYVVALVSGPNYNNPVVTRAANARAIRHAALAVAALDAHTDAAVAGTHMRQCGAGTAAH